jgi:hypothetical protein
MKPITVTLYVGGKKEEKGWNISQKQSRLAKTAP